MLLLFCSAFFSGSETSMMAINRYRLNSLIRRGNRSARYADVHGPEHGKRMLDGILRKNGERSRGAGAALQEPGADLPDTPQGFAITNYAPAAGGVTLCEKGSLRRILRPALEPVAGAARTGLERQP